MAYDDEQKKRKPDLSYLSTQPPPTYTETAGMPTALAAIASRNLAAEDAGLAKINAVNRNNVTPGVGAPGSTPQTDAGNLSIADSMERSDRGQRFGFGSQQYAQNMDTPTAPAAADPGGIDIGIVNDRRTQILRGIDPDAPAIYPNAKRKHEMLGELNILSNIAHDHALTTARDSHDSYRQQKDIESAQEFSGLVNGLRDIKSKPGTPEHAAELLGLVSDYPLGAQVPAARLLLQKHASFHDNATTLEDRSYWQRFGQAFKEASQIGKKFGVDVQYDEQGFPSISATATHAKDNGTIQSETKIPASIVTQAGKLAEARAQKDADYNSAKKDGKEIDLTEHDKKITLEQAKLDAMKEALGIAPDALTPAVDKKALAQKALSDPNASEAHKAAARKLLGQ